MFYDNKEELYKMKCFKALTELCLFICLFLKQYVDSYKKISNMVHKIYLRLKGKFNLEIVAFIKNQKKLKTLKINYQIQTTNH